jgi:hypothetical protein
VLPRPACPCLVAAQLPSPALSRTLLLTPGPPSCSGLRVSRPHRVAHARPLPCLHGNTVAHTRRPGAVAGRPALPTTAPGPLFPRPPSPCGRARRAPLPLFPLCPTPPSRLKSRRLPLRPFFLPHFPLVHTRAPVSSSTFPSTPWSSSSTGSRRLTIEIGRSAAADPPSW